MSSIGKMLALATAAIGASGCEALGKALEVIGCIATLGAACP